MITEDQIKTYLKAKQDLEELEYSREALLTAMDKFLRRSEGHDLYLSYNTGEYASSVIPTKIHVIEKDVKRLYQVTDMRILQEIREKKIELACMKTTYGIE